MFHFLYNPVSCLKCIYICIIYNERVRVSVNVLISKKCFSPCQISSRLSSEITVHGFLLWASMGFLIPIGILLMRKSNREECGRRLKILVYTHATLQVHQWKLLLFLRQIYPKFTFVSWMFMVEVISLFAWLKHYLTVTKSFIIKPLNLL